MSLGTRLLVWFRGAYVGEDEYGNRYYREKTRTRAKNNGRERRWVVYGGAVDGSKVPPVWHAWLHHTVDQVPTAATLARRDWQKPHKANATGTDDAYRPSGSPLRDGQRPRATGDYEAWSP